MIVKPSADTLSSALKAVPKGKGLPPVHLWTPDYCGEIDIRISKDGTWFHEGTPIGRPALVKLFSSILKREEGRYYLVTPVEKLGIKVEDAPLHAIDFTVEGEGKDQILTFQTKTEDTAKAGADNPIRVDRDEQTQEPSPYIHIRRGLEARIDRKTFYRMIALGSEELIDGSPWFGIWSDGTFFALIPAADLT